MGAFVWKYTDMYPSSLQIFMMTSSNGNIFRLTGHLGREFAGHRWIPPSDLRRHRAHYDIVMYERSFKTSSYFSQMPQLKVATRQWETATLNRMSQYSMSYLSTYTTCISRYSQQLKYGKEKPWSRKPISFFAIGGFVFSADISACNNTTGLTRHDSGVRAMARFVWRHIPVPYIGILIAFWVPVTVVNISPKGRFHCPRPA